MGRGCSDSDNVVGLLWGLAVLLWAVPASAQSVWFVDADAAGANTGTSWADAFPDLQDALALAQDDDEIWVAEGLYTPTPDGDRSVSFVLPSGVGLYGGFNGTEASRDERDWTQYQSILSGDVGVPGDSLDNSYNVITAIGTSAATTLDGVTVQHGKASVAMAPFDRGAGMYAPGSDIVVRNSLFRWNVASVGGGAQRGGGIYFAEGSPLVEDSAFESNIGGGGIYDSGGAPILRRLVMRGNRTGQLVFENGSSGLIEDAEIEDGPSSGIIILGSSPYLTRVAVRSNQVSSSGHGGGVRIEDGASPTFTDCLFEANRTISGDGGAVYIFFASATFLRTTFRGNAANGGAGGAILARRSPVTCIDCLFETNRSLGSGGAFGTDFTLTLVNSRFRENESTLPTAGGGALLLFGSPPPGETQLVANSTFIGNEATAGGAIFLASPQSAHLVNVTLAENIARDNGGAIIAEGSQGVRIENAVLWGNIAKVDSEISVYQDGFPAIAQSIVAGGYSSGSAILDADPLFVRNPHPGPDGNWGTDDDDYGDLRLQNGSPAVDYGLAEYLPADTWDLDGDGDTTEPLPIDIEGGARVMGVSPDLGAHEGSVGVANEPSIPTPGLAFTLRPNPSPAGDLRALVTLEKSGQVSVSVYDVLGRSIYTNPIGLLNAGSHRIPLEIEGLSPGTYLIRLNVESGAIGSPTVLVRTVTIL